jgi:2-oxoglutarate/2-oxoacid ferredoxin oxidoreductase subunit alpha
VAEELTIMLGGEAGQGLQSMGQVLSRSLSRSGLHVFAFQDYESRIRGGNSFFQVRTAARRVGAHVETLDILVAFTEETVRIHENQMAEHGVVIYDSDLIKTEYQGDRFLGLKLSKISREEASSAAMANTVALGAVWSMMGMDLKVVESVLDSIFGSRGKEVVEKNVAAARAGFKMGAKMRKKEFALEAPGGEGRLFISGTEAVALGAIASDVRFYSAYPMTPATGVMEYISKHQQEFGIVVEQAEDEISAINMAIGSSFMGARSMVGTSGGGFCLMTEGLGLAACAELPLVILNAQRPGPATGMPTRTEQCDLLFSVFASQGEFPRVVLAPTTPESAFQLTVDAFNLADLLQTPVIILSDHHLASSYWTVDDLPVDRVKVDRGVLASKKELDSGAGYERYKLTKNGISPRAWPGQGTALVCSTGDEHDETGHISEEPEMRIAMVDKRWKKLEKLQGRPGLEADIEAGAQTALIGWGSTYGAIAETVGQLRAGGEKISHVQLTRLWPFPVEELKEKLSGHRKIIVVENNSMAQMARLMRAESGIEAAETILRYDGRPFCVADIIKHFS